MPNPSPRLHSGGNCTGIPISNDTELSGRKGLATLHKSRRRKRSFFISYYSCTRTVSYFRECRFCTCQWFSFLCFHRRACRSKADTTRELLGDLSLACQFMPTNIPTTQLDFACVFPRYTSVVYLNTVFLCGMWVATHTTARNKKKKLLAKFGKGANYWTLSTRLSSSFGHVSVFLAKKMKSERTALLRSQRATRVSWDMALLPQLPLPPSSVIVCLTRVRFFPLRAALHARFRRSKLKRR